MRKLFVILSLLLVCVFCRAQSAAKADELFQQRHYAEALTQYEGLVKANPKNQLYLYRYARCLQETGRTDEACLWFERAGEKYPLRNFYLACLYADTYRFAEAQTALDKYVASIDNTNERYEECAELTEYIKKGNRYIKRVEDIAVIDSVIIDKRHFLSAYRLSSESGTLSTDSVGVVFTNARGDSRLQTVRDSVCHIASCQRLLSEWSACDTLPAPVNSEYNSVYPFMLSDGVTLYFASDNPEGLGGLDIWLTRYNTVSNTWLTPENAGYPFNSPKNDYMMAIDEQSGTGMFATDRRTEDDSVAVYTFVYTAEKHYLRDTTEEYIREAAQLRRSSAEMRLRDVSGTEMGTDTGHYSDTGNGDRWDYQTEGCFTIVINDTTVCHTYADFRSAEAQRLAKEYISLCEAIEEETRQLQQLRESYRLGSAEQRHALEGVILTEEKTISAMQTDSRQLLKRLRAVAR